MTLVTSDCCVHMGGGQSKCRQLVEKKVFFSFLFFAPLLSILTNTGGSKLLFSWVTLHSTWLTQNVPSWAADHKQTALCGMSAFEVSHQTAHTVKKKRQKKNTWGIFPQCCDTRSQNWSIDVEFVWPYLFSGCYDPILILDIGPISAPKKLHYIRHYLKSTI